MFQIAEGVLGDAREIARQMIERGERVAAYPPNSPPMFHVTNDRELLSMPMGSFEIDGTTVHLGFLRPDIEE
jgi:hypothetical protein